ncbi:hypothetical protein Pst134EA_007320 [Puccinia striiformis f. sp. tritici]|nr:hypothetical protein Pst134EA_007320 [Puccinia striiformis f. sp. tritici]KAH9470055.1 hypothetical protein Pst134EA_007320 [Puccinia striiformis f. sp. tritici]
MARIHDGIRRPGAEPQEPACIHNKMAGPGAEPQEPDQGLDALEQIVVAVSKNITCTMVATLLDQCELFEGLCEEGEASLYVKAVVAPPAPDTTNSQLVSYELQIWMMAMRSLGALDVAQREDDTRIKAMFLVQLAGEHKIQANRNVRWWGVLANNVVPEPPEQHRLVEVPELDGMDSQEVRDNLVAAHKFAIWSSNRVIRNCADNIHTARGTILVCKEQLGEIRQKEQEMWDAAKARQVPPPNHPVPAENEEAKGDLNAVGVARGGFCRGGE